MAGSIPNTYEGHVEYKGPDHKNYKPYFAVLLPQQISLRESMTAQQSKAIFLKPGSKCGNGKTQQKRKVFEFFVDGVANAKHYFKVQSESERKSWLDYLKIAETQDVNEYKKFERPQDPLSVIYGNSPVQAPPLAQSSTMMPPSHYSPSHVKNKSPRQVHTLLPSPGEDHPPPLPPDKPQDGQRYSPRQGPPYVPVKPELGNRDSGIGYSNDGKVFHPTPSPTTSGEGVCRHDRGPNAVQVLPVGGSAPSSGDGRFRRPRGSDCSTPVSSGEGTVNKGVPTDIEQYSWYMEGMSREQSEKFLEHAPVFTLLYRSNVKGHCITVKRADKTYHHRVEFADGQYTFRGLDNVNGNTIYNVVDKYLEVAKDVVPYGGSIDKKKEGYEEYDKPWNPPDKRAGLKPAVVPVEQLADKRVPLTNRRTPSPPDAPVDKRVGQKLFKEALEKQFNKAASLAPTRVPSNGSIPQQRKASGSSIPAVETEQTYVNEGEDTDEDDGVYEVNENELRDNIYQNCHGRGSEDVYQNTSDITSEEFYQNVATVDKTTIPKKNPKATPRLPEGQVYMNKAVMSLEDSNYYLELHNSDEEGEGEVYEMCS